MSDQRQSGFEVVGGRADPSDLSAEFRYEVKDASLKREQVMQRIKQKRVRIKFLLATAEDLSRQIDREVDSLED